MSITTKYRSNADKAKRYSEFRLVTPSYSPIAIQKYYIDLKMHQSNKLMNSACEFYFLQTKIELNKLESN